MTCLLVATLKDNTVRETTRHVETSLQPFLTAGLISLRSIALILGLGATRPGVE